MAAHAEHPFSEFIKILGKGKKGSRALTQDEAYRAMTLILNDQVEAIQLGAFLMLLRVKEETAAELAGFVQAARASFVPPDQRTVADLDWSSYAGKRRHLPWFLLATFLLAENGIRVFMHGAPGHTEGRVYTEHVLRHLGYPGATSMDEASRQIKAYNFSYLSLARICPKLYAMINLRPLMGLRSPVHSLVRLLNPGNAPHTIQGIFHPSYGPVHQQAALLLNQSSMAVIKGEGGETERNPDLDCLVQSVKNKQLYAEQWPALFARRHVKSTNLNPQQLADLWRAKISDAFAEATVIGTTAIVLKLINKADTQQQAHELASTFWQQRKVEKFWFAG